MSLGEYCSCCVGWIADAAVASAEPPNPRKKKPLTELEMALKREETARKRKNLSEKKLAYAVSKTAAYLATECDDVRHHPV